MKITPLTVVAPSGVSKERIQEILCLQQASLQETMEKKFLVERMKTNMMINSTLKASLKSFNDFVLFSMTCSCNRGCVPQSNHLHHLQLQFLNLHPLQIMCLRLYLHHSSHHHQTFLLHVLRVDHHFLFFSSNPCLLIMTKRV